MLDASPAKVIQIGDNAHNRVAQACDRCRRKKIRCDGKRPCCTQCTNVGFECVTSDKLSRRAFPRGYTESLETKVRLLQAELKQLRQVAETSSNGSSMIATSDSKDQSGEEYARTWPLRSIPETWKSSPLNNTEASPPRESLSMVSASPAAETNPYSYRGLSSIGGLIDVFKNQHKGDIRLEVSPNFCASRSALHCPQEDPVAKPVTDRGIPPPETQVKLIDKYFQEWNPIFPILDKADLNTHRESTKTVSKISQDKERLTLKYLILGVGSLSGDRLSRQDLFPYELLWRDTLSSMMGSDELLTLQCLLLAQLLCIHKGDTAGLLHYQNSAIALVFRLALHLSQTDESISVADRELRKRLFWTQYTIHCFSAAYLGQGVLLDDYDIRCEYPSAAEVTSHDDDTSVGDRINGSSGTAPSLALFKLARPLSRILRENYTIFGPFSETRLGVISTAEELSSWFLWFKTNFCHDGSARNITDRNALILRAIYSYVSMLLHRPTVACCAEADHPSTSNFEGACKATIRDLRQLEQNDMVFVMCTRSEDLLLFAGTGLLMQQSSSLASKTSRLESQALIKIVSETIETGGSQRASELSYLIELAKLRSSSKRSNSLAMNEDLKDEQMNGRNKIRKTQKEINAATSFDTPEITTPIKVEHAISNCYTTKQDTKSPFKSTLRRISTVQSEPSYSPIRSSPVKRIPRNVRQHDATQSYDLDLSSNTDLDQPMQSWVRAPPIDVESLRVDVSTAQWARAGNFVATPSDHTPAAMSASFNHSHGFGFYNDTYGNNPTSAPHTNNLPFSGNNNFGHANANIHPNSHIHIHNSNVNNTNVTNVDAPLMTPTDDYDPSWNTPSSVWDSSPAQSQNPVTTMTGNCCNNMHSPHGGSELSINACINNQYTSHQAEQHPTQNSHPHHPPHSHHPYDQQHRHAAVDVHGDYPQTGNYVPVPTLLPAGDVVTADPTYEQSMMMAAATAGAYGHLHTPP